MSQFWKEKSSATGNVQKNKNTKQRKKTSQRPQERLQKDDYQSMPRYDRQGRPVGYKKNDVYDEYEAYVWLEKEVSFLKREISTLQLQIHELRAELRELKDKPSNNNHSRQRR